MSADWLVINEYGSVTYKYESGTLAASNSVSSVAVGYNNVGGVIGFNDSRKRQSELCIRSILIRIYQRQSFGAGDCVGGFIGLNLPRQSLRGCLQCINGCGGRTLLRRGVQ